MKVAVAGIGNFGPYLLEEIPKEGHEIVILTRSQKPHLKLPQKITDYTIPSLESALQDVDAVVSAVPAHDPGYVKTHLALLEACKLSPRCKNLIISHWAENIDDVTDHPIFPHGNNTVHELTAALRAQNEVTWTAVCCGWLADYVLPASQRRLGEIGDFWVQDREKKVFTVYGPGTQRVSFTPSRDVARAVARLLSRPGEWTPSTFVRGETMSWNELWRLISEKEEGWTLRKKSMAQSVRQLVAEDGGELSKMVAEFELMSYAGALEMPEDRVARDRERFFEGLKFRTLAELMDEGKAKPESIL
ncbi:hypothetical protein MCOR25_010861 [Pyricularia grisea]|uniref:NmrA-like domain-containing protein n=1 Tax=Pyricularia grisea TaxID=148305 RepID=A0A6P8BAW2_PYRGI|nr:uncharacterized protein PgNI_02868 [Pyricularia grisea]KAI6348039.1 hypothetical protein MCOR25_010861 [Pyricularia grisea]TLD12944.1 hypothetical protein PgNI_02868 [Pyricularia grisea]